MPRVFRILIIESDLAVAELYERALNAPDRQFIRFWNSHGVDHLIANMDIDLVIACNEMVGAMDGVKMAEAIKRQKPNLPILLITGGELPESSANYVVLAKPLSPTVLALRVKNLLQE